MEWQGVWWIDAEGKTRKQALQQYLMTGFIHHAVAHNYVDHGSYSTFSISPIDITRKIHREKGQYVVSVPAAKQLFRL